MDATGLETVGTAVRGDLMSGRVSRMSRAQNGSEPEMVAQEIESLFATLLVSEMRKGLEGGFFGTGPGADTFNGWFDEEIGSSLASRSSLGLAGPITEAIVRQREAEAEQAARIAAETETSA